MRISVYNLYHNAKCRIKKVAKDLGHVSGADGVVGLVHADVGDGLRSDAVCCYVALQ